MERGGFNTMVYNELRKQAHHHLSREGRGHTLQTTELIHEAYVRLCRGGYLNGVSRDRFLSMAALAMREVLVDHARRRRALKRGGNYSRIPLDDALVAYSESVLDLIALDEALSNLREMDPQMARGVELRFFGGLSEEQTAEVLGVSNRTVRRDWKVARLWLYRELSEREDHES